MALAREGADVAVLDIDRDAASKTANDAEPHGVRALALEADVARRESVERAVQNVLGAFARIDILVNNAGISPKRQGLKVRVVEMDPGECDRVIAVNLSGVFLCSRAVLPGMIERKYKVVGPITPCRDGCPSCGRPRRAAPTKSYCF